MANFAYTKGLQRLGTALIDLDGATMKVQAVATGSGAYVASQSADESLADIPASARIGTAMALTNASFTDAVFDADDVNITNSSSTQVGALVIFMEGGASPGVESESWLLLYIDTATGLPYSPGGIDIPVAWSNGASKIFKIG